MRLLLPLLFAAALLAPPARAMEFTVAGDTLVMSGPVVSTDLVQLRNHLAASRIKLIVLHESPGGDLWNGYQLGIRIRDEGLPTAVSGKCESACGLIFLSGTERFFTDGRPIGNTMVGLHGAHATGTQQVLSELGPRMAYVISSMTDRKFPADLLQRTVYPRNADDMVYAFHPARYPANSRGRGVLECLKQPDISFKCTMLDGLDALGIGVITTPEILKLPADVKQVLEQFAS
jgi:hypothetical protein